jgi:hypothetical protein
MSPRRDARTSARSNWTGLSAALLETVRNHGALLDRTRHGGQAPVGCLATGACGTLRTFVVQALKRDAGVFHRGNREGVTGTEEMRYRIAYCDFLAPRVFLIGSVRVRCGCPDVEEPRSYGVRAGPTPSQSRPGSSLCARASFSSDANGAF